MIPLKCIKTEVRVESTDMRVKKEGVMKGVINSNPCNKRQQVLHKINLMSSVPAFRKTLRVFVPIVLIAAQTLLHEDIEGDWEGEGRM